MNIDVMTLTMKRKITVRCKFAEISLLLATEFFSGAFAETWKTTISFAMSVCLPAWKKLCPHWTDFHDI